MVRVAVDAMGGDKGPAAVIEGALAARGDGIEPIIFGSAGLDAGELARVPTTQVVGMDEKPADAFRTKADSSLVRAVKAVADGEAGAARAGDEPLRALQARRAVLPALSRLEPLTILEDATVPRSRIAEMVGRIQEIHATWRGEECYVDPQYA